MKYTLYDLEIVTIGDPQTFNCSHQLGETLVIRGENVLFKKGTTKFSHYAFASLIPYIAAKQRTDKTDDWMFSESDVACPDPHCGARFRFKRVGQRVYDYTPRESAAND